MAASIPKARPGVRDLAQGSVRADVLTFLIDHLFKGKSSESVPIAEIVEASREQELNILVACQQLEIAGLLKLDRHTAAQVLLGWRDIGSVYVKSFRLELGVATTRQEDEEAAREAQGRLDLDGNGATAETPSRYERKCDQFETETGWCRMRVVEIFQGESSDGLLKVDYLVEAKDYASDAQPEPEWLLKEEGEALTVHEAFEYFDTNYRAVLAIETQEFDPPTHPITGWLESLAAERRACANPNAYILLEPESFKMAQWYCDSTVTVVDEEAFRFSAEDKASVTFSVHEEGHRWPGFTEADERFEGIGNSNEESGPEPEGEALGVLFWAGELEDESRVEVSARPIGDGRFEVTFAGPVSKTGICQEQKTAKAWGQDFDAWAMRTAEKKHRAFVGAAK